ncbi:MAG: hypothetical protein PHY52_02390 [Candidatus Pacebacteria bacterium]|jgi:hypothetical protein|nr:hypothetical protein [Dehalococcoidia bacterium]MDD5049302.1 hypothetical protein [Methanoregulaceae archaeon]MDD5535499.1 hypothetical protein [Candidatus Paceibacterota bacterium]
MKMSTKEFIEMIATPGSLLSLVFLGLFIWILNKMSNATGIDAGIQMIGVFVAGGLAVLFGVLWFITMDLQALKIRINELKKTV